MADPSPQNPQGVPTELPGQSLDDYLAAKAKSQLAVPGQLYKDYVAEPGTRALVGAMPSLSEPNKAIATTMARQVVPQNLTQAGVIVGTGGAGALGFGALGRVAGAIIGGAAGGLGDTGDWQGAAAGGLVGGAAGTVGEAIGGATNFLRGSNLNPGTGFDAKRAIQTADAQNVAAAIPQIPKLRQVFGNVQQSPDALYDLVHGFKEVPGAVAGAPAKVVNNGEAALSGYMEASNQRIKQALGPAAEQAKFPDPLTLKAGSQQALPDWFTKLPEARQAELRAANPSTFKASGEDWSSNTYLTWDKARANLTRLGEDLRSATGAERGDLAQQYAEAVRQLQRALANAGPAAVKEFNDSRGVYQAGRYFLDTLKTAFDEGGGAAKYTAFNSQAVVRTLNREQTEAAQKLGPDGLAVLREALHGSIPGRNDVFAQSGMATRLFERIPGGGYVTGRLAHPDIVNNPLGLGQGARTGITLGTEAAGGLPLQNIANPITDALLRERSQTGGR